MGYDPSSGRFGLRSTTGDPDTPADNQKLLTFSFNGRTHNTRIWIDGDTPIYGASTAGRFTESPHWDNGHLRSVWTAKDIEAVQDLSYVYGGNTGRVDTVQIKYVLTNKGSSTREVGLRVMLDTLIGSNDGVPFVVPGRSDITGNGLDLREADVPDFIQALEQPNLTAPGVIVHFTLRGADATPPDRLVISAWCNSDEKWDYYTTLGGAGHPLRRCGRGVPDSAVGLYFNPQPLSPGQARTIITYYGLGGISSTESKNPTLSLTFSRTVRQGETFWITALINNPQPGQTIRLTLPAGLALTEGSPAEQSVTSGGDYTQVSWRVVAEAPLKDGAIVVTLQPTGVKESQTITVLAKGITR
jgi:hypothetical protein